MFRADAKKMSPLRGFASSETTMIYKQVASTALLKNETRPRGNLR